MLEPTPPKPIGVCRFLRSKKDGGELSYISEQQLRREITPEYLDADLAILHINERATLETGFGIYRKAGITMADRKPCMNHRSTRGETGRDGSPARTSYSAAEWEDKKKTASDRAARIIAYLIVFGGLGSLLYTAREPNQACHDRLC